MKLILFALLFCCCTTTQAQFGKDLLNKVKESGKRKVNNKIDQKIDQGTDKVVDAPEKAVKNKKNKSTTSTDQTTATTTTSEETKPVTDNTEMTGDGAQTVIQTNILCEAGKKKVEALLSKQDGIFEVKTNIKNGELSIRYSSDGTTYTGILQLINEQGFEADGNKPAAGSPANPCKKK